DQLGFAVGGGGKRRLDHHLGAEPSELADHLRKEAVVTDCQAKPADALDVEGDEAVTRNGALARTPGEDLAVASGEPALRSPAARGVVAVPPLRALVDRAGGDPEVVVAGDLSEALRERPGNLDCDR